MTVREIMEEREYDFLSPFATKSKESKGRRIYEKACDLRTDFQRDVDRITHSKAFRRLMHKTQVFLSPSKDHYRTRLTHTLEVSQIARAISRGLSLNETLTEAIALGHDLGHTPFGHIGEDVLNSICEHGFMHNEQSLRVVDFYEKEKGLNLTMEVRDGILNHQTSTMPHTLEGKVVRFSDKIAYVNSDFDDAIRAQILCEEDVPLELRKCIGFSTRERLDHFIHDIITNSFGKDDIIMSKETEDGLKEFRAFMFENVYRNPVAKSEEKKAKVMLKQLYNFYLDNLQELPYNLLRMIEQGTDEGRVVCDYISGMTDQYAITKFKEYFVPLEWQVKGY